MNEGLHFEAPVRPPPQRTMIAREHFRAENIVMPAERFEFSWEGADAYIALHDIVIADSALRVSGSQLPLMRDIRNRVTIAPEGVGSGGWVIPDDRPNRMVAIYFDQSKALEQLHLSAHPDSLAPHAHVRNPDLEFLLAKISRVITDEAIVEDVLLDALFLLAAAEMFMLSRSRPMNVNGQLTPHQVERVRELIDAKLGGKVSLQEMADAAGLSAYHFSRAFKRAAGVSPYRFLLRARVERAQALIRAGLPLAEVIAATGFAGPSQFSRTFVALTGETPSSFRKRK